MSAVIMETLLYMRSGLLKSLNSHDKHVVFVFSDHGQLGFYSPYITHQAQVVQ